MIVLACALSYAILESACRVRAAHGHARVVWLVAGSLVVGMAIWALHFVALLSLRERVPLTEDPVTLGVAAVTAVVAAAGALNHVDRGVGGIPALAVSGGLKGFALVATHYTMMAALHVPATIAYDPVMLAWSAALAIVVSTATLWFAERLEGRRPARAAVERLTVALVMGAGLAVMHDAAMRAGHFVPDALWTEEFRGGPRLHALPGAWLEPWITAAAVATVAVLAMAASLSRLRARRHGIRPAGDRLTGLPNGTLLRHRLAAAVAAGERCAVIFLRLESHEPVGQVIGRRAGERLLVRVGWRLVGAVRPDDLAARLPGAEYAVLVRDGEAAESVAESIRERFAVPVTCDDLLVVLPVGIGVAVARPGEAPSDVLARARRAAEQTQRRPLAAVA